MIEIYPNVWVGSQEDAEELLAVSNSLLVKDALISGNDVKAKEIVGYPENWFVLHCCKEPYHRKMVGYTGRGAPKDSPEYLFARRGNRMALNMVDASSPRFFSKEMIDKGLDFLEEGYKAGKKLLIHCNRGESRSPSLAMLFVFKHILKNGATFDEAEAEMKQIYPAYAPADGIRGHLMQYWNEY